MYCNNEWLWPNICIMDSHNFDFELIKGDHCFIICHHIKDKKLLEKLINKILSTNYRYFNVFGEKANIWRRLISKKAKGEIEIESSQIDRLKMVYDLAMISSLKPKSINHVISDDEYFTEYLVEDLDNIFSGKSLFTPSNWKKIRDGFEFTYNNKDAIISVDNDIMLGYLGDEKVFDLLGESIISDIFDGKSFAEIWPEVSKMAK
ncbi:hypothetical protein NH288_01780 [Anaerococcus sp. NML200537]|uniref:hypothetical protein n=1 Tax=Anaerococcus sp. NML200537 TaxID=2954485 RepID=UPI002238B251|nr:hypothetical protein [Anaerococcus sp. NML200537]MCW6700820.1 hypothetical protein [Anaerococcus sp. NML200537]